MGFPVLQPVDAQGKFTEEVPWAGVFVKDADKDILRDLKDRKILYKSQKYTHTYSSAGVPHTLLYYGRSSWFIKTTAIRDRLLEVNNAINAS